MPTYEYVCDACEHEFEEFQSITAKPLRKCPECGKARLKRLIGTGAGIIFKGSGFYETDYRSESYKKGAKAESDGGSAKKAESSGSSADAAAKSTSDTKTSAPSKPDGQTKTKSDKSDSK